MFSLLRISVSSVWSVPGALGTEQIQPHEGGEGAELSAGQHKELRSDKPPALREGDHYCQLVQLRKLHTSFTYSYLYSPIATSPSLPSCTGTRGHARACVDLTGRVFVFFLFLRQAYNTAMRHLKASLLTAQVQFYVSLPRKTSTACISAGRPYLQTRPRAQFFYPTSAADTKSYLQQHFLLVDVALTP